MGKRKPATSDDTASDAFSDLALIVFGRDERNRPHASAFSAEEQEMAERAAGLMSMQVLRVITDEHRAVASELPAGKIFSSGKGFVPFVAEGTYTRLEAFPEAFQPAASVEPETPGHETVPATWADVVVGGLVLASEGPRQGFYECVVVGSPGDDLLELRWVHWPNLPPVVRRREHVALLSAALAEIPEQLDAAADEMRAVDA